MYAMMLEPAAVVLLQEGHKIVKWLGLNRFLDTILPELLPPILPPPFQVHSFFSLSRMMSGGIRWCARFYNLLSRILIPFYGLQV